MAGARLLIKGYCSSFPEVWYRFQNQCTVPARCIGHLALKVEAIPSFVLMTSWVTMRKIIDRIGAFLQWCLKTSCSCKLP